MDPICCLAGAAGETAEQLLLIVHRLLAIQHFTPALVLMQVHASPSATFQPYTAADWGPPAGSSSSGLGLHLQQQGSYGQLVGSQSASSLSSLQDLWGVAPIVSAPPRRSKSRFQFAQDPDLHGCPFSGDQPAGSSVAPPLGPQHLLGSGQGQEGRAPIGFAASSSLAQGCFPWQQPSHT